MSVAANMRVVGVHLIYRPTILILAAWVTSLPGAGNARETIEKQLKTAIGSGDHHAFLESIGTRPGIDALIQLCDESPAKGINSLEVGIANMLQAIRPEASGQRAAIRQAALSVLRTTDDRQIALGLVDLLIRYARQEVSEQRQPDVEVFARQLYSDMIEGSVHPGLIMSAASELAVLYTRPGGDVTEKFLAEFSKAAPAHAYQIETFSVAGDRTPLPAPPPPAPATESPIMSKELIAIVLIGAAATLLLFITLRMAWSIARRNRMTVARVQRKRLV